jgi:hypothetical protein
MSTLSTSWHTVEDVMATLHDYQHPIFSSMVLEWLGGHQPEEASGWLNRLGVDTEVQDAYFGYMSNEDVTIGMPTPHQVIDITATMAFNAPKIPVIKFGGVNQ